MMSSPEDREKKGMTSVGFEAPQADVDQIERLLAGRRTQAGRKVTKGLVYRRLLWLLANDEAFQRSIFESLEADAE